MFSPMEDYPISTIIERKFVEEFEMMLRIVDSEHESPGSYLFQAPYEIDSQGHIESVNLDQISPSRIPLSLFELPFLKSLAFNNCNLLEIPQELRACRSLKRLSFFNNSISRIPEWFGEFHDLEEMNFESEPITSIPMALKTLKRLKEVRLTGHALADFPKVIYTWKNLEKVSLSGKNFDLHKMNWKNHPKLKSIHLDEFENLELSLQFSHLRHLEILEITTVQNISFPPNMNRLLALKEVYLYDCQLKAVPEQIFRIPNLETLNLDKNKITTIPPQVVQMTCLETLRVTENPITKMTPKLISLPNLFKVFIDDSAFAINHATIKNFEKAGISILNQDKIRQEQKRSIKDVEFANPNFGGLFSDRMGKVMAIRNGNKHLIKQLKQERRRYYKKYGITGLMDKPMLKLKANRKATRNSRNKYQKIAKYKKTLTSHRKL